MSPDTSSATAPTPPLTPPKSSSTPPCKVPTTPPTSIPLPEPAFPPAYDNSLHIPLQAHLALLHPSTPPHILAFCATRLLSRERPYGFDGVHEGWDWAPIHLQDGGFDLQTAGVGRDATKGLRQGQTGPGRDADEMLERQYEVARKSWKLLEAIVPGTGSAL